MSEVENKAKSVSMTSDEKLAMALHLAEIEAKAMHIRWTAKRKEQATEYITEMCTWSKTVNMTNNNQTRSI